MNIKTQWEKMIQTGTIPTIELETNEGFICVDVSLNDSSLSFSFDNGGNDTFFSGSIEGERGGCFFNLPVDPDQSLDWHLQEIHTEIVEGFLIPNNLI